MANPYDFTSGALSAFQLSEARDARIAGDKFRDEVLKPYYAGRAGMYDSQKALLGAQSRLYGIQADTAGFNLEQSRKGARRREPFLNQYFPENQPGTGLKDKGKQGGLGFKDPNSGTNMPSLGSWYSADDVGNSFTLGFNASPEDSTLFRENNSILDKTYWVSLHPNIPYLLKNYNKHFANLYADSRHTSDMKLHLNGWLEIKVNLSEDSIIARTLRKVRDYAEFKAPNFRASNLRFQYLIKTIELLQKHGQVYLVRLPVGNEILTIENKIYPSFNEKIKKLSTQFHAPYIDFTSLNTHYVYVDGNHISTKSVTTISEQVSDSIMKYDELNKQH
jgi:hypothetical protein